MFKKKIRIKLIKTTYITKTAYLYLCYGPSVISVMATKGGHLRDSRLYKTSGTIG